MLSKQEVCQMWVKVQDFTAKRLRCLPESEKLFSERLTSLMRVPERSRGVAWFF